MSTALLAPQRVLIQPVDRVPPTPHKFTAIEFNEMGDRGWFEGRRAFLIDGVILEQGPMYPLHATGILLADAALRKIFDDGWTIRVQLPLHVDKYNDPLPDFAVLPGGLRDNLGRHPVTASLLVEVSDTTLHTDLTEKAERYARAGIAEYWVLDMEGRRLFVLRDPVPLPAGLGATAYSNQQVLGSSERVSPLAVPGSSILVSEMLP